MLRHDPLGTADFAESVRLLRELHLLTLAGQDESAAAEAIRDSMEAPWCRLDDHEEQLVRGLSADLYSIGVDRTSSVASSSAARLAFSQAVQECRWNEALDVLRNHEPELPPSDVACLRGICWANLQQHDVAAMFFAEALRLRPDDVRLKAMFWRALIRAERRGEVKEYAELALRTATNPYERALAADVLLDWAADQSGEQAGPVIGRIVETMTSEAESPAEAR